MKNYEKSCNKLDIIHIRYLGTSIKNMSVIYLKIMIKSL